MKRFSIFFLILALVSCEDAIDVDLNDAPPKLVIDASIDWFKGTNGNIQEIKLTLSAPFFDSQVPPANGAQVKITNSENVNFIFLEQGETGIYRCINFIPKIEETYTLTINYNEEEFIATETLKAVSEIDFIEQNNEGGFTGEDIELKAFYTDPPNLDNYYFFEFTTDLAVIPDLEVYDDEFTDGNQIFGFFSEEDLESGDLVNIRNHGVSEQFYEFMFILLQQTSEGGGGPFETQPATVRGNCFNSTDPDNFPLGYFRLSEVDEVNYIVE